jgi:hypothetical protein
VNVLVHALDGRLRVRVERIKRDPAAAASVEQSLLTLTGVKKVRANPVTGSVLVFYDPWRIGQNELLELFGVSAEEREDTTVRPERIPSLKYTVAEIVVRVLLETACHYAARRLFALPIRM